MRFRLALALLSGRVIGAAARLSGRGGGTALPGLAANRLYPALLPEMTSRIPEGVILVSGTNGKTTTSRLLALMLTSGGKRVLHNRTGSNLIRGIAATIVASSHLDGRPIGDVGLFETDEAVLPGLLRQVRPRVVVLNNLFRDQLDRYGELDSLYRSWEQAVSALDPAVHLVVNADDPALARLGELAPGAVTYFGVHSPELALAELPHAADSGACPRCTKPLVYSAVYVSHLGEYHCSNCGFSRPQPDVLATEITLHGTTHTELTLRGLYGEHRLRMNVPGIYNVYNGLAATAAAYQAGVPWEAVERGYSGFSAAFGRFERIHTEGRSVVLALVKNPVGCNEVLRMLSSEPSHEPLLIVINDQTADGRDVSWLWDADFELLATMEGRIITSGLRAADMAVRLKYAGIDAAKIQVEERIPAALRRAMEATSVGGTLRVMPTYTAMLALRAHMGELGWVEPYWEE
ncbi:MAG: Mur ligase family protein [Chloroflexia bacterium]|nr:Mur ligase family protein [Chloroflexia bacterium]